MSENSQPLSKTQKKLNRERQNALKPGECHKYLTIEIDPEILAHPCGSQITKELTQGDFRNEVKPQIVPMTITWKRNIPPEAPEDENIILFVIPGQEMLDSVRDKTFLGRIENFRGIFPTRSLVILVYGLKDAYRKSNREESRYDIGIALVEAQVLYNCCHRLIENPADLAATVVQFSKSVAEGPFKREEIQKAQTEQSYFTNSKDNVKIHNGVGYSRLWQQHLIKFPHVALEAAQAITGVYPMPRALMDAFEASPDAENLLADIPVRRSGGPLAAQRKIGHELSRKIHKLYTSNNPDDII